MSATDRSSRIRQRVVASYDDYTSAQRAVDHLSDQRFPVEAVTIIGSGLRFEERVTGRRGYGRAIAESALSGAVIGAFIGFFFGLFSVMEPLVSGLVLAVVGALVGAVLGALIGAAAHAATGGQRDFASQGGFRADRYEVLVDAQHAEEAQRILNDLAARS